MKQLLSFVGLTIGGAVGWWMGALIQEHSEAEFTHGFCPNCAQEFNSRNKKVRGRQYRTA